MMAVTKETASHVAGIRAVNLVKVFPGPAATEVHALNGAGLTVKPGSITVLLGPNGAGKTTLISILTGLEGATSGNAWINGLDVSRDMSLIRQDLGVCPQFDILWPELSVTEHLRLHGAIKGFGGKQLEQVVTESVVAVGLQGSEEQMAGDLSGGQKRKLSLAAALLGQPSVVLVDEPTSGTDPYTRRFTWELLRAVRAGNSGGAVDAQSQAGMVTPRQSAPAPRPGSAVLLTTHSMEEAEELADHVVIMAQGRVVAQGSPQELKAEFGEGYTLTLVTPESRDLSPLLTSTLDDQWVQLLRGHVPGAVLLGRQGDQVSFRLPRHATAAFPAMLRELDRMVADTQRLRSAHGSASNLQAAALDAPGAVTPASLRVTSYGISVTTLEEVFLRVTGETGTTPAASTDSQHPTPSQAGSANAYQPPPAGYAGTSSPTPARPIPSKPLYARVTGARLVWQQLRALLVKRALCARRERLTLLTQLLVPLLLVALSLWAAELQLRSPDAPVLVCDRARVLMGGPTTAGAVAAVREGGGGAWWRQWLEGYGQAGSVEDCGATDVWKSGPIQGTMEGCLLGSWYLGRPSYDAVVVQELPSAGEWLMGGPSVKAVVLLNQTAVHGVSAALSQVSKAAWNYLESVDIPTNNRSRFAENPTSEPFHVSNHPLPTLPTEPLVRVQQDASGLLLVVCLTLASSLMSASAAVHLVRERASKAKHVQLVSGAPTLLFWVANGLWDYLQFSVTALGIIILIASYHMPQYSGARLWAVAGLLAGFGAAGLSMTFLLQGLFTDEMLALQRLNTAYFLVGYLGFVATWIIDLILFFTQPKLLKTANTWVKLLFRLLSPHFCFSKGVFDVSQTYKSALPFGPKETNPFAWSVWGSPMTNMMAQAAVYFALTVLTDSGFFGALLRHARHLGVYVTAHLSSSRPAATAPMSDSESLTVSLLEQGRYNHHQSDGGTAAVDGRGTAAAGAESDDEDVSAEKAAVQQGWKRAASQVLLDGVTKTYHQGPLAALRGSHDPHGVRAVRGLWLGVPRGECFGLLGVNGAGKTTTFSMLTGEILPDSGDAYVCRFSVTSHLGEARHRLGYCPQFESLLGLMTPREVLTLYARLRGVPPVAQGGVVDNLLIRLGLGSASNRQCGTLSGGNKRRLALAVALVGDPPVTLCDEPSTGVDPGAKRSMWSLLKSDVMGEGHSLVLTSHSMEECDALCDRLAIMVAGKAACLGSPQHLKTRFGGGYLVDIRCVSADAVQSVLAGLRQGPCPGASMAGHQGPRATITVPREDAAEALPDLFEWLERHTQQPAPGVHGDAGCASPTAARVPVAQDTSNQQPTGDIAAQQPSADQALIVEYSVRQATLEHVFLHMAHQAMHSSQQ